MMNNSCKIIMALFLFVLGLFIGYLTHGDSKVVSGITTVMTVPGITDTITVYKYPKYAHRDTVKAFVYRSDSLSRPILKVDSTMLICNDSGYIKIMSEDIESKGIEVSYKVPEIYREITRTDTLKMVKYEKIEPPFYDTFMFGFASGIAVATTIAIAILK